MDDDAINFKYRFLWEIGVIFCALFYFSGIYGLYLFYRKNILKRDRAIVLTYHRVHDGGTDSDISVSIDNFRRQIVFLGQTFDILSLTNLLKRVSGNHYGGKDIVAITLDDGYKDTYSNVYPLLKQFDLPAYIFLVTRLSLNRGDRLSPDEIMIMKGNGIGFGGHTRSHRILSHLDTKTAFEEISGCKTDLEILLQQRVDFFAYPKGKKVHFTPVTKSLVREAGFRAAFSTENGEIDQRSDLFELNRIGIRNCPLFVFKVRVSGLLESKGFRSIRRLLGLT